MVRELYTPVHKSGQTESDPDCPLLVLLKTLPALLQEQRLYSRFAYFNYYNYLIVYLFFSFSVFLIPGAAVINL